MFVSLTKADLLDYQCAGPGEGLGAGQCATGGVVVEVDRGLGPGLHDDRVHSGADIALGEVEAVLSMVYA